MSLRFILMEFGGLFDQEQDREMSEDTLLWFLELLCDWNQKWLKKNPGTPRLYESGVVYKLPEQMEDGTTVGNVLFRKGEHFRDIPAIMENGGGDCFPLSQKVIVRSYSTGLYELISIGELRHVYTSYEALSYNLSLARYEFQPIIGFVDKGVKPVCRAHLSNGTDLVATEEHKFWSIDGSGANGRRLGVRTMGEYVEAMKLSPSRRTVRSRIVQAAKIPALGAVRPDSATAYLAGIYAAEGNFDGKHTCIAQHKAKIRAKIETALANVKTGFRYRSGHGATPGSGAYYALHGGASNPTVAMMREQGLTSFDKMLPSAFLSGDEPTLAAMVEGHGDGDAWRPAETSFKRPGVEAIYATSSDLLMEQLRFSLLALGRPTYAYRYLNHGGEGTRPIWRLHEWSARPESRIRKRRELVERDLAGLTYGVVLKAERHGEEHVGCIEVANNHNFFLADGTLVSNCDNLSAWRVAELRNAGHKGVHPYITSRERPDGGRTYHALVYWPTPRPHGSTEDPSLLLGMGGAEKDAEREAEWRKNAERAGEKVGAIKRGISLGLISPQAVRIAALKRGPK